MTSLDLLRYSVMNPDPAKVSGQKAEADNIRTEESTKLNPDKYSEEPPSIRG
jgi:hypothetical protein